MQRIDDAIKQKKLIVSEVSGIDFKDYPELCDAYISKADNDGKELNDSELEHLNENHKDFVFDNVWDAAHQE